MPREERIIDLPEALKVGLVNIGDDCSERLAYRPCQHYILRTFRPHDQPLLLELIEDRHQTGSLIINSQPTKLWHYQFADNAIMDRIVHNAEKIELKGKSTRKNPAQTS